MSVPERADTTDLRSGPQLHDALLEVLPLVGEWGGRGTGIKPANEESFSYAQRVVFSHDGRPFLSYQSQSWLLGPDGSVLRPAFREAGFLRPGAGEDQLELLLTSAVGFSPTAKQVAGERRLYALTGDHELSYVSELALQPAEYRPHLNASLTRG